MTSSLQTAAVLACVLFAMATCAKGALSDDSGDTSSRSGSGAEAGAGATGAAPSAGGAVAGPTSVANTGPGPASTGSTATVGSTGSGGSGAAGGGGMGTGGGGNCPVSPTNVMGCPSCLNCPSNWPVSWSAVTGATHYFVKYTCFTQTTTYQTNSTMVDLCNQVGMCNNSLCANGVTSVTVEACNGNCCSSPVSIPDIPIACGGGVCC